MPGRVFITGIGIISAIGDNVAETLTSLIMAKAVSVKTRILNLSIKKFFLLAK